MLERIWAMTHELKKTFQYHSDGSHYLEQFIGLHHFMVFFSPIVQFLLELVVCCPFEGSVWFAVSSLQPMSCSGEMQFKWKMQHRRIILRTRDGKHVDSWKSHYIPIIQCLVWCLQWSFGYFFATELPQKRHGSWVWGLAVWPFSWKNSVACFSAKGHEWIWVPHCRHTLCKFTLSTFNEITIGSLLKAITLNTLQQCQTRTPRWCMYAIIYIYTVYYPYIYIYHLTWTESNIQSNNMPDEYAIQ